MATKLTSSLRKSISAEKATVEEKLGDGTTAKPEEVKPIAAKKTPQAAKKIATPEVIPVEKNVQESVATTKSAPDTSVVDFFTKSNHTLAAINATLEAVQSINQDIKAYTHNALHITSFNDLYQLNTELLTKLRLRQQKLIEENIEIFSHMFKQD